MERPYIKQFLEQCTNVIGGRYQLTGECFSAGVVRRGRGTPVGLNGFDWATRDSIDGIVANINDQGVQELIGIECKCRAAPGTAQRSRDEDFAHHGDGLLSRDTTIAEVWFGSQDFKQLVTKNDEAIQLAHHAYSYGFNTIALLIGDSKKLRRAIFVRFSNEDLDLYGRVLKQVYIKSLEWIYCPDIAASSYDEDQIRGELSRLDANVTFEAYESQLALFRLVNLNPPADFTCPLPPVRRIIPITCAMWNVTKGGSDAISKLIWKVLYNIPKHLSSPQTVVVARMHLILVAVCHRLLQHGSAKWDLSRYYSVQSYRNAANKRTESFSRTLVRLKKWFVEQRERERGVGGAAPLRNPAVVTRLTRAELDKENRRCDFINLSKTFATPSKNRAFKKRGKEASAEVIEMVRRRTEKCTGIPLFLEWDVNKKKTSQFQLKCFSCGAKTSWVCVGCHRHLCMNPPVGDQKDETRTHHVDVPFVKAGDTKKTKDRRTIVGRHSCYHQVHCSAIADSVNSFKEDTRVWLSSNATRQESSTLKSVLFADDVDDEML
jgi:hypothetical protein